MDNKVAPDPSYNPPSYEDANGPAVVLTGPVAFVPYQGTYEQPPNLYPEPPRNIEPTPPVQIQPPRRDIYRNQLGYAIILAVVFFPLAFFWIPAILFSLQSRKFYDSGQFAMSAIYGRKAKNLNVGCFIFGNITMI